MFCYQPKYSSECTELTSELFSQLVVSNDVNRLIGNVRRFRSEDKPKAADLNKRQLPLICFCASHFDVLPAPKESKDGLRKKGQLGKWRLQDGVHLNGLYMVDIDHISQQYAATNSQGERVPLTPRQLFQQWVDEYVADNEDMLPADPVMQREAFCCSLGIRLVHITSSNDGLRLVAEADIERGNLAENQAWLAKRLGFKLDESCKDASRGSFCPGFEDLLYINKDKLFTYENKKYDEKFGKIYRGEAYPQPKAYPQPLPRGGEPEKSEHGDGSNHNSCVPAVASDQRSSAQFSILNSQLKVTDSDLEFARLIGDWCLMAQMHMYGQMVMDAQEREQSAFVPRKRSMKIREAYARLPEIITTEILVSEGVAANMQCASMTLRRWLDDGLVEKADNKSYRKKYKEIPI